MKSIRGVAASIWIVNMVHAYLVAPSDDYFDGEYFFDLEYNPNVNQLQFNLTFNKIKLFGLCLIVLAFSREDVDHDLDNPYDPTNMDLDPPALFFHPPEVSTSLGEPISVEVYGLKSDSSAGAHFDIW